MATPPRNDVRYPLRTRIVVVVALVVAVGGFVVAGLSTETGSDDDITVSGASGASAPSTAPPATVATGIERFVPARGAEAIAQQALVLDLSSGWTGELVVQPETGEAVPIPEDQIERNSLEELRFQPGEGKVLERLPSGRVCVLATIWDQVRGRQASERVDSWCFDVT